MVSFCIYVYLSTFFGGRGGGCQNKKISVRTGGGGGGVCPKTNKGEQGGGGGGQKSANLSERTF